MDVYQNRLDSFSPQKRGKNVKKWPHPSTFTATPTTLAEAGFYFRPSASDPDNVVCFMCDKQLSTWESTDDPLEIHFQKCQVYCSWAVLRCGMRLDILEDGSFKITDKARLPWSKAMEKARLETFTAGTPWVHDRVKGHGASSKNMVKAGFVHTPQPEDSDCATCLYCKTCLSGWDADDDPLQEHRRRVEKNNLVCAFFTSSGKSSKSSKAKHVDEVMPVKTHDGALDEMEAPEGSTARTPRKARTTTAKKGAKTPRARNQSQTEDDDEAPISTVPKSTRKKTNSKSKALVSSDDEEDDILPVKTPKSRGKAKRVAGTDDESDNPLQSVKPSHSRTRTQSKVTTQDTAKTPAPRTVSRTRTRSKVTADSDAEPAPPTAKPKSRSKSTKHPTRGDDSETNPPPTVRKASRTVSKSRIAPSDDEATRSHAPSHTESEDVEMEQYLPPPTVPTKDLDPDPVAPSIKPKPKPQVSKQSLHDDEESNPPKTLRKTSRTVSKSRPPPSDDETMHSTSQSQGESEDVEMDQYLPPPTVKSKQPRKSDTEKEETPTSATLPTLKPDNPKAPKSSRQVSRTVSTSRKPVASASEAEPDAEPLAPMKQQKPRSQARPPQDADERVPFPTKDLHAELSKLSVNRVSQTFSRTTSIHQKAELDSTDNDNVPFVSFKLEADKSRSTKKSGSRSVSGQTGGQTKPPQKQGKTMKVQPHVPVKEDVFYDAPSPTSMKSQQNAPSQSTTASRVESIPLSHRPAASTSARHDTQHDSDSDEEERRELELKLVQISSDEEEMPAAKKTKSARKENKAATEDVEMFHSPVAVPVDLDTEMPLIDAGSHTPPRPPVTPVQVQLSLPRTSQPNATNDVAGDTTTFPFFPPLSQEPFVNIESLSEEELSMTVEEWIKYQINVEYEKFKKDGERELEAFAKRAEEVRIAIEAL